MKYSLEYAASRFADIGYILLDTEYINSKVRMNCICSKGHYIQMSLQSILNGHICSKCANNVVYDISYVRSEFLSEDYKLLTAVYINNKQKLKCICPKGHIHITRYDSWVMGKRCRKCYNNNISIERSGPNHPNWCGGISFEPYCEVWKDKEFKHDLKERDGFVCQNPNCWGTSNTLVIHHIDYDKKNCHPCNLITVCNSCNSRANKNRAYWYEFFKNLVKEKQYGY